MRFIKPSWLTHGGEKKDFEVYSCHVSPDGSRLVTAAGDGYVRVWSTEAIYNAGNPEYTKPKQLASMSYHSGTIHTVRFSPNGKYLASGADDKIVCVYTLDPNAPSHASTFGTNEAPPVESWRIFRRLIGHDNDVQDLGWSYDSSILVSVGLDSKVVVWSGHTFEKLKTLSHHQSHVKGLTFDPANKYFATASDDRTIKVFRFTPPAPNSTAQDQMNNFHIEYTITAPFASSPLTTYFRRCSWSPDGNHIAAANAVNGPVSSVAIVNRGSWDSEINLIGHEGPVEVCAFSPRLFGKDAPSQNNQDGKGFSTQHLVTVIACAGQDKALSIWNTSHPRPLVITQDLAVKSISDLAWSPDGRHLFATSLDGSVISVVFDEGELGYVVGLEENEKALAKFGAGRRGAGVVEGTDGLLLEEKSKAGELKGVQGRMGELMGDSRDVAAQKSKKGGADASTSTPDATTAQDGSATQSGAPTADGTPVQGQTPQADQHAAKLERLKQRVTITKDGKKRIAPLLVSSSGGAESSMPRPQLMAATAGAQAKADAPQSIVDLSKPFDGLPKGGLTALLLGNKRKAAHIEGDEDGHVEKRIAAASRGGAVPILVNGTDGVEPATPAPGAGGVQPTPEFLRPAVVNPSLAISQVRLAVPKVRTHIVRSLDSSGRPAPGNAQPNGTSSSTSQPPASTSGDHVFEARNPSSPAAIARLHDRDPAKVTVTRKGQTIWQDFLPRPVLLASGNRSFWAAACEDGSIYVWTPAGRRLLNALVVEAQPVILEVRGSWVLCITAVGMCHVWNVKTLSSPHPPVSLGPVLDIAIHSLQSHPTVAPAVTSARLNSKGFIIVTLSNGDGYVYSPTMYVWQRLSEGWWAVGSQYWNTTDASVGNLRSAAESANAPASLDDETNSNNLSAGIIPHVERNTTNEVLLRGRAYFLQRLIKSLLSREGYEGFESSVSIAHLENRLAAAMHLGAKDEFRTYLDMYAKRLGAEGLRTKVEELLSGLLGGIFRDRDGINDDEDGSNVKRAKEAGQGWYTEKDELCGWNREELLRSVLLILGKHRDLQRVTVPYAKLLGVMDHEPVSASEDTPMT